MVEAVGVHMLVDRQQTASSTEMRGPIAFAVPSLAYSTVQFACNSYGTASLPPAMHCAAEIDMGSSTLTPPLPSLFSYQPPGAMN